MNGTNLFYTTYPENWINFYIMLIHFRLENGWYVRDIPSPVSGTGASSTVPSSPPSETEFENVQLSYNNHLESLPVRETVPSSKQSRKVRTFKGI